MSYDSDDSTHDDFEDSEKLKEIRDLFEDAVDHSADSHLEAHRAERFYHNSECEGQWETDDLAYLRDQLRPALTFNIIKGKVDTFTGMYSDAQRRPTVVASSGSPSDLLLAEVVNIVKDQQMEEANYERLSGRMFKTGSIAGECGMHVEVEESPDGEGWVNINLYRILMTELHWDVSSVEPDRSDARYVFWDRWLSKSEFKQAYPDHSDRWNFLSGKDDGDHAMSADTVGIGRDMHGSYGMSDDYTDDGGDRFHRYYYDRRKRKIRVVRYEYKTFEKKYYVLDRETMKKTEVEGEMKMRVEMMRSMGSDLEWIEKTVEVVKVCEFAGNSILAEFDQAGPFEGFSIISYCYEVDEETGTAYGLVRNLFDPQQELNKSISLEIEYLAQSTAPGVIAEEDQITNVNQFSDEMRRAGGVAVVKRGALAEGRVQDRNIPPPSAMVANRKQSAMEMLNEVSTIPSASNLTAAEHSQAGVSVALRYHKSRQSVSDPFAHFEDSQQSITDKVCQIITTVMPDDQIEHIISREGQFQVQDGRVVEMMTSPDGSGQQVPKAMAMLRDIKGMKYSLDMEYSSENSTLRMLELEVLMAIESVKPGMVDPELLVERATSSRSVQERAKNYIEKQVAAASAGQQAQAQAMEQQTQQYAQIEAGKIQETQRHNQAEEQLKFTDQQLRERLGTLDAYLQADDKEKARMFDMAKFAMEQRAQSMTGATA